VESSGGVGVWFDATGTSHWKPALGHATPASGKSAWHIDMEEENMTGEEMSATTGLAEVAVRGSRRGRLLTATLAAFALLLLGVGGSSASAKLVHPFISSFDGSGTPAGSMNAHGIAVDNSSSVSRGDVYVSGFSFNAPLPVNKFSASGSYLSQIVDAASGPLVGTFAQNAVNMNGDLFVAETGKRTVDEFGPTGAYLSSVELPEESFPWAEAVNSSGEVLIAAANAVYRYDPATSSLSPFSSGPRGGNFEEAFGVAVDDDPSSPSYGHVYVVEPTAKVVDVFDSSGTYLSELTGTPSGPFPGGFNAVVDPASGDLYVDAENAIDEFSPTGAYLTAIDIPNEATVSSVAVNAHSGDIYAAVDGEAVDVFGPAVILPDVTTGPATDLRPTGATLHGHVDPAGGGRITACRFEYGTSSSYGETVPCSSHGPYWRPIDVSANLGWLTPSTTYHFRLSASNANGADYSEDGTFETPPLPTCEKGMAASWSEGHHAYECKCPQNAPQLRGGECRRCDPRARAPWTSQRCPAGRRH
jgi:hypothetical protein